MNHHLKLLKFTQVFLDAYSATAHGIQICTFQRQQHWYKHGSELVQTTDHSWVYSAAW